MAGKDISFEKALEKLEIIVDELESGDLVLESSLKKFEEGVKLADICKDKLSKAKKKIETLKKNKTGKFVTEEFEADEI